MPHVFNGASDLYVFGGAITAGASVTWFREQFCQAEMPRPSAHAASIRTTLLEARRARTSPPGARRRAVPALPDGRAQPGLGCARRAAPSSASACTTAASICIARCSKASASRCSTTSRPAREAAQSLDERADRRRRRRAFRPVDADHRRRHRPAGARHRRRTSKRRWARRCWRRSASAGRRRRGRAARLGPAGRARAARRRDARPLRRRCSRQYVAAYPALKPVMHALRA